MPNCPRCHQPVDSKAISCPYCKNTLKAFGHPGITLHQETGEGFLCDRCAYHEDDTCNFPQRPYAKTCTLYKDKFEQLNQPLPRPSISFQSWLRRNQTLLIIIALIAISVILAIR